MHDAFSMARKEKEYLTNTEIHEEGHELRWRLRELHLSTTLSALRNDNYRLYRQSIWESIVGRMDKDLGAVLAIFHNQNSFYLEFQPEVLISGTTHKRPRKHIKLKREEKDFLLPQGYYLLKSNP